MPQPYFALNPYGNLGTWLLGGYMEAILSACIQGHHFWKETISYEDPLISMIPISRLHINSFQLQTWSNTIFLNGVHVRLISCSLWTFKIYDLEWTRFEWDLLCIGLGPLTLSNPMVLNGMLKSRHASSVSPSGNVTWPDCTQGLCWPGP